jgi:hypothetical protein
MSLEQLPPELILLIADSLPSLKDVSTLLAISRKLYGTITPWFYRNGSKYFMNRMRIQRGDGLCGSTMSNWLMKHFTPRNLSPCVQRLPPQTIILFLMHLPRESINHDVNACRTLLVDQDVQRKALDRILQEDSVHLRRIYGLRGYLECVSEAISVNDMGTLALLLKHPTMHTDIETSGYHCIYHQGSQSVEGGRPCISGSVPCCVILTAAIRGDLELMTLLEEKGAHIDGICPRKIGDVLIRAVLRHDLQIVEYLVKNGADVYAKGTSGISALQVALHAGHDDAVRALLTHGARVDGFMETDGLQITALGYAVIFCKSDMVRILLELGARAAPTNGGSYSVIDFALSIHRDCQLRYTFLPCLKYQTLEVQAKDILGLVSEIIGQTPTSCILRDADVKCQTLELSFRKLYEEYKSHALGTDMLGCVCSMPTR